MKRGDLVNEEEEGGGGKGMMMIRTMTMTMMMMTTMMMMMMLRRRKKRWRWRWRWWWWWSWWWWWRRRRWRWWWWYEGGGDDHLWRWGWTRCRQPTCVRASRANMLRSIPKIEQEVHLGLLLRVGCEQQYGWGPPLIHYPTSLFILKYNDLIGVISRHYRSYITGWGTARRGILTSRLDTLGNWADGQACRRNGCLIRQDRRRRGGEWRRRRWRGGEGWREDEEKEEEEDNVCWRWH